MPEVIEKTEEAPLSGDPKDVVEVEEAEEEEETEEAEEEEETEEEDLTSAKELVAIFKDPIKFRQFISKSAKDIGIIAAETGQTKKEVEKDYLAILKESLGEEYAFLADKFAPVFKSLKSDAEKVANERMGEIIARQTKSELTTAWVSVNKEIPDFKQYEDKIAGFVQKYPYDGESSVETYLKDMYTLASGKGIKKPDTAKVIKKIVNNANEAQKLASVEDDRVTPGKSLPTIKEAVKAAVQGKRI